MRFLKSLLFLTLGFATAAQAQPQNLKTSNPVLIDKAGVMRWIKTNGEAAFFGVNYTVPFAYGYRSHKALNVDLEKAIHADVYHFARLGLDAFRVHVWDTEISDSLGNLKENEHLKLFDYLLYKLKERNIKILLTPLAFWGSGYPEPDVKTGSFSSIWNKQQVLVTEAAIKAQENYLQQFLKHVNPYTNKTYDEDEDVIALEINNEPHHSGTKQQAADYIERMVKAVKSTGWTKPVFYNISESPSYADAVANADIDGVSFQWYPTGLVAGHELKGNYLPNADVYRVPFDTIATYKNKARMVYEFDAGDVLQSYMYPAMARSFRTAGFQWATQFAYDPMATAYANTEYQTHYLNLAYTPAKAISLLIAAKAFRQVPRGRSYGAYPADSVFENVRVSYENALSEWNSDTAFYYSNNTGTQPKAVSKLKHIAGVGSSSVVSYAGSGAYFLDKLANGTWRLEVMPDAVHIRDPFEKASPQKEVTRIEWNTQTLRLHVPDLTETFFVTPLNKRNTYQTQASGKSVAIRPGTYLISNRKTEHGDLKKFSSGVIGMQEFAAPAGTTSDVFVKQLTQPEATAGEPLTIDALIVGLDSGDRANVELRHALKGWKTVPLQKDNANMYVAAVPSELLSQGVLNYRIIIRKRTNESYTFPGGRKGDPYAWDNYSNETYETLLVPSGATLSLFNASHDRNTITLYNPDWRSNHIQYNTTTEPGSLALEFIADKPNSSLPGFQIFIRDKIQQRAEAAGFDRLVVKAGSNKASTVKISLVTKDGAAFAYTMQLDTVVRSLVVPLNELKRDSSLLLPRPYPGFMPLYFTSGSAAPFSMADVDKLQVVLMPAAVSDGPLVVDIQSVWLEGKKP